MSARLPARARELLDYCRCALEFGFARNWRSYDPYDLLSAAGGDWLRSRSTVAARCVVQVGLRSGERLRRTAGMRPHEEAKAIADFLSASVVLSSGSASPPPYALQLVNRLEQLSICLPKGRGWGLSFPYASRFVSVPAGTPNAYTTITCVKALADASRCMGDEGLLRLALEGARTIDEDLGLVCRGSASWFRYWPGVDTCIVNVQALIAGCFQELGTLADDEGLLIRAAMAAEVAMTAQREDGSFPYAVDRRGAFVDAFHTGFVLEGLGRFHAQRADDVGARAGMAVSRGMEYLRAHLMAADSAPRRCPDGPVALDGQNIGQLVQTLAVCGKESDRASALAVWDLWTAQARRLGARPSGSRARMVSMRWDVSPTALAAARLAAGLGGPP